MLTFFLAIGMVLFGSAIYFCEVPPHMASHDIII